MRNILRCRLHFKLFERLHYVCCFSALKQICFLLASQSYYFNFKCVFLFLSYSIHVHYINALNFPIQRSLEDVFFILILA